MNSRVSQLLRAAVCEPRHRHRPPPQHCQRSSQTSKAPPPPRQVTLLSPPLLLRFQLIVLHAGGWEGGNNPPPRFYILGRVGCGPALMSGPGPAHTKRSREDCWVEISPFSWAVLAHIIIMLYILQFIYIYIYIYEKKIKNSEKSF